MEDDHKNNQETVHLLEDGWFFGNLLNNNKKGKMLRCNSDPAPSSKIGPNKNATESANLLRTPSLPPNIGSEQRDWGEDDENEDDDDGPRMGDLIRQAMPLKLSRTPSLPPCRIKKEISSPEKGPTISKLTRRSSLDPSMLLPPKQPSKGKIPQHRRSDICSKNVENIRGLKSRRSLERSMSLKSLSDKEVQGFQDLGFEFRKEDLSPSVVTKLSSLTIKEEPDEEEEADPRRNKNPSFSEAWIATQWSYSPPIPKWVDTKSSAEDMKAQIKFWARAVASNVRQEC